MTGEHAYHRDAIYCLIGLPHIHWWELHAAGPRCVLMILVKGREGASGSEAVPYEVRSLRCTFPVVFIYVESMLVMLLNIDTAVTLVWISGSSADLFPMSPARPSMWARITKALATPLRPLLRLSRKLRQTHWKVKKHAVELDSAAVAEESSGGKPAAAIFELEIPREWRFSRISYPGRGPVSWNSHGKPREGECKDLMDDEKYDETTAFPLLKPNIEVFGLSPPATLRRQRGWYQRKQWPPLKGKAVDHEEKPATGEDVPPELFDIVLGWLVKGRRRSTYKDRVEANSWEPGSMALVCRRWAKLIQPIIYKHIILRNGQDVATVRKSLQSSTTAVSKHLQYPQLNLNVTTYPYIPWIHIACSSKAFAKGSMKLRIQGPLPSSCSMKGFHDMLPRSGPWFCSRITDLWLKNVHFKSLPYLMRAIGDMPDLMGARLEKATWDCPSDDELHPPLARHARFCMHPTYIMEGCTDDAAVVWFQLLLQLPGSDRLVHADADRLYRIVSALSIHGEYKQLGCPKVEWQGIDVGVYTSFQVLFNFREDNYRLFCVHATFTPAVEGHAVNIKTVAIIDNIAGCLSSLETFYFLSQAGGSRSKADILFVHHEIVAKMPNLRSSSKVRYGIEIVNGPNWEWTRADISSGDDEPKCKLIGPCAAGQFGWLKFL
ncbi:hypothetical protein NM688_g4689 [Phlebia brevispora]|uniref:Uncharacterized protein n=1 Tax=Phlebia brevispora TaxID=194682 RepID=A0ACC1T273_9APHY|nr:hypothetical protein NM688_g4689 [Phlebia brevispora]